MVYICRYIVFFLNVYDFESMYLVVENVPENKDIFITQILETSA